jgi:hypothetical protein
VTAGFIADANEINAPTGWFEMPVAPPGDEGVSADSPDVGQVHQTYHSIVTMLHELLSGGDVRDPGRREEQERAVRELLGYRQ